MTRSIGALASLQERVVLLARHGQLVEVESYGRETCIDLEGRGVVGSKQLTAGFQHLAADRPLHRRVPDTVENDIEGLQGCEARNRLRRTSGACGRAIHRSSELSRLGPCRHASCQVRAIHRAEAGQDAVATNAQSRRPEGSGRRATLGTCRYEGVGLGVAGLHSGGVRHGAKGDRQFPVDQDRPVRL